MILCFSTSGPDVEASQGADAKALRFTAPSITRITIPNEDPNKLLVASLMCWGSPSATTTEP